MWGFQNNGALRCVGRTVGQVHTADGKFDQQVIANWYFPTGNGQQATVPTIGLGWGKVNAMSTTTFVTPGVINKEDRYVVSWAKVWDEFSGKFLPELGPFVVNI